MKQDKVINGNCWVAYFDILGFKNEIRQYAGHLDAFAKIQYEEILQRIEKDKAAVRTFTPEEYNYCCFSDSFLFYMSDDSISSYLTMHFVVTGFFHYSGIIKMPLRGALTCGDFYADKENNIYLGEAIIDAHDYAEKQDWIGLVLAPNARAKLEKNNHDPLTFAYDFREYDVPIKQKKSVNGMESIELRHEKLFAHTYGIDDSRHDLFVNWLKSVCNDKEGQKTEYRRKYENTLKFYEE